MPPHRTDPRIDSCPELQPSSDATPCLWHGDVEGIHEGRALRQRQGKPGSAGWLGPFSGVGTHKATQAIHPSKQSSPPSVESRVQRVRAKLTYPEA